MGIALVVYFVGGLIVTIILSARAKGRGEETELPFLVFGGAPHPILFVLLFALWPIWVVFDIFGRQEERKERERIKDRKIQKDLRDREQSDRQEKLIHSFAETSSALRPYGTIVVDEMKFEARSKTGFISPGSKVVIVGFDSGIPVVEETKVQQVAAGNVPQVGHP